MGLRKGKKMNKSVTKMMGFRKELLKMIHYSDYGSASAALPLKIVRVLLEYFVEEGIQLTHEDIKTLLDKWPTYKRLENMSESLKRRRT